MSEFTEPSDSDYRDLASKWVSARTLIEEEYGYELDQSLEDLKYLQRVIDDRLVDFKNRYALECLGVVLGRVMARNVQGLDWWIVDDEYGRDLVIRFGASTLLFNVLNLIAKPLSETGTVDASMVFNWVEEKIREIGPRAE